MADTQARNVPAPDAADDPSSSGTSSSATSGGDPTTPEPEDRGRARRFVGSTPFLILVALVIAIVVKSFLVQAFYIPSASMEPTLDIGDRVFVNKLAYDLGDVGRGDVIVFQNPSPGAVPDRGVVDGFLHWLGEGIGVAQPENEDFIKRVIGLPGETLEIRDNVVYIDGEPIDEPYLTREARRFNGDFGPTEIPADSYFVMGDNRGNSADSRYGLGFVPEDKIIGRAFVVIWPPSHMGGLG
jgi:signal peptidase I